MIKTFKDKEIEKVFQGRFSKKIPQAIQRIAERKLIMLHRSVALQDLRVPPANRLEALKGERTGQHSIRINQQWRICFLWQEEGVFEVEIVDYHWGMSMRDFPPIHPGEILLEEFLKPMGISQYRLAQDIGVPAMRISKIVREERGISADTALRLARYFGMSVEFWTGLQIHFEIEKAKMTLEGRLEKEVKVFSTAAT